MFGKRGMLWPAKLTCGHTRLVAETALRVNAALCRVCPQEPIWPIRKIDSVLELTPA